MRAIFLFILCIFYLRTDAQVMRQDSVRVSPQTILVRVRAADREAVQRVLPTKMRRWVNDSTLRMEDRQVLLVLVRGAAYLAAGIDSCCGADSVGRLWLGPPVRWATVRVNDLQTKKWLSSTGEMRQFRAGKPVTPAALTALQTRMLAQAENNGYPFAAVWLDSIVIDSAGYVSAALRSRAGPYFEYFELKINGEVKIRQSILARYLGIKKGEPFNRAQVLGIKNQLKSLPYLEQYANPTLRFSGNTATVNVWLKKKKAGRFDFIVGLLPQPDNTGTTGGSLLLTGSMNGTFLNALGQGERLSVEMERLRLETQKLDVQASVPYILGSPFGFEGRLNIFRRDSTWVDAQGNIGVLYLLSRANKVSFLVENRSSYLQRIDSARIVSTRTLPANLDFRQYGLGIETEFTRLDYRFNPRKGYVLQGKLVASRHTIEKNNQIVQLADPADPLFEFASLYDAVAIKTIRIRPEAKMETYLPFANRITVLLRARGGGIFTADPVTQNEQYRLGGNKLLRGFDEESLFATKWAIITSEVRLIMSQNAFMSVFADGGYIENITGRVRNFQRPLGIGAGMNFETPAGVFGISAAAGRLNPGEGFDLRATKIHVGFVSLF